MQFFAHTADARGERRLDIHVHVFELNRPGKVACLDLMPDRLETVENQVFLFEG